MRCGGTLQEGDAVFRGRAGHGLQVNGMSGNEHYLGIFSRRGVGLCAHKGSAQSLCNPGFLPLLPPFSGVSGRNWSRAWESRGVWSDPASREHTRELHVSHRDR
jgi:hypothetical protein